MGRLTRIAIALSYLSLAAVPLYGASEGPPASSVPRVSKPIAGDASRVESFRSQLLEQQKALQSYGAKIFDLVDRLKAMSGATAESRMTEVRGLREALVQLGTQLQPDAPLSQSIDQYQSWVSAQIGRLNSQRGTLGSEFVQELLGRYRPELVESPFSAPLISLLLNPHDLIDSMRRDDPMAGEALLGWQLKRD